MSNISNIAALIDQLGELKAKMADLSDQEAAIKKALGDLEPGAYEGEKFRLSVSVSDRDTLDMAAVREHLSRQFIQAHTTTTSVRALRVTARKGGCK